MLKNFVGCLFFIDMRRQISVSQNPDPSFAVNYYTMCKRFPHHRFRAVDIRIAHIQKVFPTGFPGKLGGKLKPLDNAITHRIGRVSLIFLQCFAQTLHCFTVVCSLIITFQNKHTLFFDIIQQCRICLCIHNNQINFI